MVLLVYTKKALFSTKSKGTNYVTRIPSIQRKI